MSELKPTHPGSGYDQAAREWQQHAAARRSDDRGLAVPGWLLAGLAVAGLGYLAWRHFGADFQRYLKMRSM